ncbi:hypothetical protein CYMTET_8727 [Cymbomonas tetramitiformis]|uniref:Uncharacterized protein n=1 Tax=Cymbomonas tetramitiformis TaxID=36881 RepID=A0AAE0LG70_9CHLO|nr:hypothetical protein CYMTET_8727 [Cymbomonas tetramitiformis]
MAFIEEKVHAGTNTLVTDSVLTKWVKEFENQKAKDVMNTHAKASASSCVKSRSLQDGTLKKLRRLAKLDDCEIEALRVRELASPVLVRLGLERNEKKGQWELTQLVEHLGLEVDLKAGEFRVMPATLQKIYLQAKALLSQALSQRQWLPAQMLAVFVGLYLPVSARILQCLRQDCILTRYTV